MNKEVIVFFYSILFLEFPNSAKNAFYPPGIEGRVLHGRFISNFQGKKGGSECVFCFVFHF